MDLETFANLFTGSPFKPLQTHRTTVVDALLHLNRQLQSLSSESLQAPQTTPWIRELPRKLEKIEQDVLIRLNKPSLTSQPRELIIDLLQTQSNLSHQIFRLSERLSYRPLKLPAEMIIPLNNLTGQFGKTVSQVRHGVLELDTLKQRGFKKQHSQSLTNIHDTLVVSVDKLRTTSHEIRDQLCELEQDINPVDVALLFLILDDISDLSLWMRTLIIHLQT